MPSKAYSGSSNTRWVGADDGVVDTNGFPEEYRPPSAGVAPGGKLDCVPVDIRQHQCPQSQLVQRRLVI